MLVKENKIYKWQWRYKIWTNTWLDFPQISAEMLEKCWLKYKNNPEYDYYEFEFPNFSFNLKTMMAVWEVTSSSYRRNEWEDLWKGCGVCDIRRIKILFE